jgi:hypothetical protein
MDAGDIDIVARFRGQTLRPGEHLKATTWVRAGNMEAFAKKIRVSVFGFVDEGDQVQATLESFFEDRTLGNDYQEIDIDAVCPLDAGAVHDVGVGMLISPGAGDCLLIDDISVCRDEGN